MSNSTTTTLLTPVRRAYLGLGSNLQDPRRQIQLAINDIHTFAQTKLIQTSECYRTQAVGPIAQDDFINAVVAIDTTLPPDVLMARCLALEKKQGRIREHRWGPRIIDCDILWYEDITLTTPELTLPHPEMPQRLFVLVPLAELAPKLCLSNGKNVIEQIVILQQQGDQKIMKIGVGAGTMPHYSMIE